ncbi:MAG: hypothetical protein RJB37_2563 [Pseudomonadota bacterium]|jgi:hypothetical protein
MPADDLSPSILIEQYAQQLRGQWLHRSFGDIRFWGFAVVRPNDQSFVVVSVQAEGDRLDLRLVHESRQGHETVLSIWSPRGLQLASGLVVARAARLVLGDCEAWSEDDAHYRIRTPRGEGSFPMESTPALRLGC